MAERRTLNPRAGGSSPSRRTRSPVPAAPGNRVPELAHGQQHQPDHQHDDPEGEQYGQARDDEPEDDEQQADEDHAPSYPVRHPVEIGHKLALCYRWLTGRVSPTGRAIAPKAKQ